MEVDNIVDDMSEEDSGNVVDGEERLLNSDDIDDEKGMNYNILHISKASDLSPRHTSSLKAKTGRFRIPL